MASNILGELYCILGMVSCPREWLSIGHAYLYAYNHRYVRKIDGKSRMESLCRIINPISSGSDSRSVILGWVPRTLPLFPVIAITDVSFDSMSSLANEELDWRHCQVGY